jgi:hypothetical protein
MVGRFVEEGKARAEAPALQIGREARGKSGPQNERGFCCQQPVIGRRLVLGWRVGRLLSCTGE